jgi:hypothetical protein
MMAVGNGTIVAMTMTTKRKRVLKKNSQHRYKSKVGGNFLFERGSWVSKISPWVKKNLLKCGPKKKCDSTFMIASCLVIG